MLSHLWRRMLRVPGRRCRVWLLLRCVLSQQGITRLVAVVPVVQRLLLFRLRVAIARIAALVNR